MDAQGNASHLNTTNLRILLNFISFLFPIRLVVPDVLILPIPPVLTRSKNDSFVAHLHFFPSQTQKKEWILTIPS